MKIEFNGINEKPMEGFKGGKGVLGLKMFEKRGVKFLSGRLEPNATIGMHRHDDSCEIILVLSGNGKAVCDGETEILSAGQCHYCAKGSSHSLINSGNDDLVFVAAVPDQR